MGVNNSKRIILGISKCTRCNDILTEQNCKYQKHYVRSWCKKCHIEDNRKRFVKRKYGIEYENYQDKLNLQNNICDICGKQDFRNLSIDHDHKTNEIRGLLCRDCNIAIALLREDEDIIWNMIEYLKKYKWMKKAS